MNIEKYYKNREKRKNFKKKLIETLFFGGMIALTTVGCEKIREKYREELEMMRSQIPYRSSIIKEYDGYQIEYELSKNGFGYDEKIGFWTNKMPELNEKVGVIFYDDDNKQYSYTVTEAKNLLPLIDQFKKEKRSFAAYKIIDEKYK